MRIFWLPRSEHEVFIHEDEQACPIKNLQTNLVSGVSPRVAVGLLLEHRDMAIVREEASM